VQGNHDGGPHPSPGQARQPPPGQVTGARPHARSLRPWWGWLGRPPARSSPRWQGGWVGLLRAVGLLPAALRLLPWPWTPPRRPAGLFSRDHEL